MIITDIVKQQLYEKTAGRCIICDKRIANSTHQWSVEHFIPRAIYKWLPNATLKKNLESYANLFIVHIACNNFKDSSLPTLNQLQALKLQDRDKKHLLTMYITVETDIQAYRVLKQSVWNRQLCKCLSCQKMMSLSEATLRRFDSEQPRGHDNAMCVCFGCSIKLAKQRNKSRKTRQAVCVGQV